MELMSGLMRRMSGFEAMPAMMESEQQKQMDEMRKQMDEMMGSSSMKPDSNSDMARLRKWRSDAAGGQGIDVVVDDA